MRTAKLFLLHFSFVIGFSTSASATTYHPDTQISVTRPVGENFVRDGIEQRYWGVNINLQPWHTLASIERMTTRIKRVGFNSIRLWPNWKTFYGIDARNSVTPPPQGFHFATYVKGDGSQLDLFDKMVYECRQKKMPIYMTSLMFYPPLYTTGDYVDLVTTNAADRQAWIDAMSRGRWLKGQGDAWWVLQYIDERVQEIWKKHALLFLNHVNQYTGLRYADDNNVVMWQLHNEGRFLAEFMLNNDYRTPTTRNDVLPLYFQHKLQSKFNAFLKAKYGTTKNLLAAWGTLNPDESLEQRNIDAGAKDQANVAYGKNRVIDFTEFAVRLVDAWNESFTRLIRAQGKGGGVSVAAIATDTTPWPTPAGLATLNKGSMIAFGNYPEPQGNKDKASLKNPWTPRLQQPAAWAPYDFGRPAGKPVVVYETNYNSFALFDAELPWAVSAMSSWQNISGVFWYFWNAPFASEEPAPYGQNVFTSRGCEFWGDEVFISALQSAGEAFLRHRLPTASNPAQFSIKESVTYNPDWSSWRYTGINPGQFTLSGILPSKIGQLLAIMQGTAFQYGARVQTVKKQDKDVIVTGNYTPYSSTIRTRAQFPQGVDWSGPTTSLTIDTPTIKAYAGYLATDTVTWSDGFSVRVKNRDALSEGALHEPFVAISLSSSDGHPLSRSSAMRFTAVSHSFNADMSWAPGSRVNVGTGALVTRRPDVSVSMPAQADRRVRFHNFAFEQIGDGSASTGFAITADHPVYEAITYLLPRGRKRDGSN